MCDHHLLVVALALDGASGSGDRRHSFEDSASFSHFGVLHDLLVLYDEPKVSDLLGSSPGACEIPLFVQVGQFAVQRCFSLFL